jgi:hypothetical protein
MQKPVPFAALVGIDWADRKHDVCLCAAGSTKRERSVVPHTPAALRDWADKLRFRFGGAPIAVCIELTQGPIVSALLEHDFFVLFPVQPKTLARYRETFTTSGAKDDPTDAEFALELIERRPTLELAQRARSETLASFFRSHNVRYQTAIDRRLAAIRQELPLTTDLAAIEPNRLLVEVLLPQLRAACAAIDRLDDEVGKLAPELPDYAIFSALPGAGAALAPRRVVVGWGTRGTADNGLAWCCATSNGPSRAHMPCVARPPSPGPGKTMRCAPARGFQANRWGDSSSSLS